MNVKLGDKVYVKYEIVEGTSSNYEVLAMPGDLGTVIEVTSPEWFGVRFDSGVVSWVEPDEVDLTN